MLEFVPPVAMDVVHERSRDAVPFHADGPFGLDRNLFYNAFYAFERSEHRSLMGRCYPTLIGWHRTTSFRPYTGDRTIEIHALLFDVCPIDMSDDDYVWLLMTGKIITEHGNLLPPPFVTSPQSITEGYVSHLT